MVVCAMRTRRHPGCGVVACALVLCFWGVPPQKASRCLEFLPQALQPGHGGVQLMASLYGTRCSDQLCSLVSWGLMIKHAESTTRVIILRLPVFWEQ